MPAHTNIYVSHRAWNNLTRRANGSRRVHSFLANLPPDPTRYIDNRPESHREADAILAKHGRMPMWSYEEPRYQHSVCINAQVRATLLAISQHWHITNNARRDGYKRTTSRIAAVIEALGSDLLTPKPIDQVAA